MGLERYKAMTKAVQAPIELNVVKNPTIRSKKFGIIDIYVIEPNEEYQLFELYILSVNNPKHFVFDKKRGCLYTNAYGQVYMSNGQGEFFKKFLIAMDKQGMRYEYLNACSDYLKEYARLCMEPK